MRDYRSDAIIDRSQGSLLLLEAVPTNIKPFKTATEVEN